MKKTTVLLSNRNTIYVEYVNLLSRELFDKQVRVQKYFIGHSNVKSGSMDVKKLFSIFAGLNISLLSKIIRAANVIIVSPGLFSLAPAIFGRLIGVNVVYFLHEPRLEGRDLYSLVVNLYQRIMIVVSDQIIVFSSKALNSLNHYGKNKAVEARLPGVVNHVRVARTSRVLCIGSVAKNKRLDWFMALAERMPDTQFTLAVNGLVDEESLNKKLLDNLELIVGKLDYSRYYHLISTSRYVVLPYEFSTQSGVLVDALGCGTPVVCTDVGSFREFVANGVNGYVIGVDNFVEEAINVLRTHYDEDSMYNACIDSYRKNFSVNNLVSTLKLS